MAIHYNGNWINIICGKHTKILIRDCANGQTSMNIIISVVRFIIARAECYHVCLRNTPPLRWNCKTMTNEEKFDPLAVISIKNNHL